MFPHQPPKPPYWQLNLFVVVMSMLLLGLIWATPLAWHQPVEVAWCIIQVSGMTLWSRLHAPTITAWDRWRNLATGADDESRLTPVQRHYRRVMARNEQKES